MLKTKIGLALGGGGARGAAHLGVLKHFESVGFIPDCLAGTSAGAVVAALYAFKVPLHVIEQEMRLLKPVNFRALSFSGLGLFENVEVENLLKKLLPPDAKIEDAAIPFAVKATDLLSGTGVIIHQGPVIPAVLASTCVPGVYRPVEIDGKLLADGGLTENVPISALKYLGAHLIIGVNLNGHDKYARPTGVIETVSNAMDIAIDATTRVQLKDAHVSISMDLSKFSRTNSDDFDLLVFEGIKATRAKIRSFAIFTFWARAKKIWYFVRDVLPFKKPNLLK